LQGQVEHLGALRGIQGAPTDEAVPLIAAEWGITTAKITFYAARELRHERSVLLGAKGADLPNPISVSPGAM
jgi:hypothetical protein